jgi:hypothetical protein
MGPAVARRIACALRPHGRALSLAWRQATAASSAQTSLLPSLQFGSISACAIMQRAAWHMMRGTYGQDQQPAQASERGSGRYATVRVPRDCMPYAGASVNDVPGRYDAG